MERFTAPFQGSFHIHGFSQFPSSSFAFQTKTEFIRLAKGTGIRIWPECSGVASEASEKSESIADNAEMCYQAGANALQIGPANEVKSVYAVNRRLGHVQELYQAQKWAKGAARPVRVRTVGGFRLELDFGIRTVG